MNNENEIKKIMNPNKNSFTSSDLGIRAGLNALGFNNNEIGWDGENDINHFKLLSKIYENEFYLSKNGIKALFLQCDTAKMFRTIDSEFSKMLCPERIQMIKMCLEHRYNEIMRILE